MTTGVVVGSSRYQPWQRTCDARAETADWRTRQARERALGQWAGVYFATHAGMGQEWKVGLVHIQPGRPMQNGHEASFHGRLRD